ncbi:MAG: hypothetical protein M3421_10610 [Bacteroidota bacterium]|nr:hypothetical protein [Bacteroidota bacterium]
MRYLYSIIVLIAVTISASLFAGNVHSFSKIEVVIQSILNNNIFDIKIASEELQSPLKVYEYLEVLSECTFEVDLRGRSDVTNCNNPNGKLTIGARFGDVKVPLNNDWSTEWYDSNGNKLNLIIRKRLI